MSQTMSCWVHEFERTALGKSFIECLQRCTNPIVPRVLVMIFRYIVEVMEIILQQDVNILCCTYINLCALELEFGTFGLYTLDNTHLIVLYECNHRYCSYN